MLLSAIITVGCGQEAGNSFIPGHPIDHAIPLALTIDDAGTYPVIEGNTERTASVWVHNNSDVAITDFSYTKAYNTNVEMSAKSHSGCSDKVSPHSSCMIQFEVPKLDAQHTSAALRIKARYKISDEYRNVDQVVNFAYIDATNALPTGVVSFSKSVSANRFGNKGAYATLYIYGTGSRDTMYTINNLKLSNQGLSITSGNLANTKLAGGQVIAVEVGNSLVSEQSSYTRLNISSSDGDKSFDDSVSVSLISPYNSLTGARLVASFPSIIDVSKNTKGEFYIYNTGSEKTFVTSVTSNNRELIIEDRNSCLNGQVLDGWASCAITFTISGKDNDAANIMITYNPPYNAYAELVVRQDWFNSKIPKPNLSLYGTNSFLTPKPNTPESILVILTNNGNVPLTNLAVRAESPASDAVTATIVTGASNTCTDRLGVGRQCQYYVLFKDEREHTVGSIITTASANYIDIYGNTALITTKVQTSYKTGSFPPPIVQFSSGQLTSISIVGDGSESTTQVVTLSNLGVSPITITNAAIVANKGSTVPGYLTLESSACTTLKKNESCALTVKLGTAINYTRNAFINKLHLRITTNAVNSVLLSDDFTATVTPATVDITAKIDTSRGITGHGQESDPYLVHGYLTNDSTVTVTYTQKGSDQFTLLGVDALTGNNDMFWQLDGSSSCLNKGLNVVPDLTLNHNDTCTIVYKNVLGQNSAGLTAATNVFANITLPTLTLRITGGIEFSVKPELDSGDGTNSKSELVYVTNSQALITNFMSILEPNTMA